MMIPAPARMEVRVASSRPVLSSTSIVVTPGCKEASLARTWVSKDRPDSTRRSPTREAARGSHGRKTSHCARTGQREATYAPCGLTAETSRRATTALDGRRLGRSRGQRSCLVSMFTSFRRMVAAARDRLDFSVQRPHDTRVS
jgi:hypothetical protein